MRIDHFRAALLAAAALFGGTIAESAIARPDAAFLRDAMAGNNGEIELGRLAQGHARDPRVRAFGTTLARDHQAAKNDVLAVARHSGIRIDARAVTPDAEATRRQLSGLRGRDFDRRFVRHMVEDHEHDIAMFERQASGPEPVTARLARKTLPHLRHHLEIARSLDDGAGMPMRPGPMGRDVRDRQHMR